MQSSHIVVFKLIKRILWEVVSFKLYKKMHTRLYLRLPLTLHAPLALNLLFFSEIIPHHENQKRIEKNEEKNRLKKAFLKALCRVASKYTNTTIMFRFIDKKMKWKEKKRMPLCCSSILHQKWNFQQFFYISCNLIPHVLVLRHISQCYHDLLIFNNGKKCWYHERIIKGCHK